MTEEDVEIQELRQKLKRYQNLGPVDHLRELVQAEKEGRLYISPRREYKTCGSCCHFKRRIPGERSGTCDVKPGCAGTFTTYQSRKCCPQYMPHEEAEAALSAQKGE